MTPDAAHALDLDRHRRLAAAAPVVLAPPRLRPGLIPRTALVRGLIACRDVPVVLVAAPAGYGKTTLLAEWAVRDERPFAWIEAGPGAAALALELIHDAVAGGREPVIVVDDAQRLTREDAGAVMRAAARLPDGAVLALATRGNPPGPAARLRAHRLVLDLSSRELAMTRLEAAMLLDAAGLRLGANHVDRLLARTEGWPAALYLAALSLRAQPDPEEAVARFDGADRLVSAYLRDELLDELPADLRDLLRHWSILDRLTPAACDAVTGAPGSAAALERLVRTGMPVEPVDRRDAELRLHPLLATLLRAELARLEPELEPTLHGRAADWCERRGDRAGAARHAVASGDAERAGRHLLELAPAYAIAGRHVRVQQSLASLGARDAASHAPLALASAICHLADGRRFDALRAADAGQRAPHGQDDGIAAAAALVRAAIARDGVTQMARDAERARALAPDGAWEAVALLLSGVARQLGGDGGAREALEQAASGSAGRADLVGALARAQLALQAADAADWDGADRVAQEAGASLPAGVAAPFRAFVLTARGLAALHLGEVARGSADVREATGLLAPQAMLVPWLSAETEIWLARAQLRLSDGPAARRLLAHAARAQAQVAEAPVLARWVHEGWALADAFAASATGDGPALTLAELRVLRLLESCMSFREIGERLHVSPNTVKTQALAVYRKLGVSCRLDAVGRGRVAGLIGG